MHISLDTNVAYVCVWISYACGLLRWGICVWISYACRLLRWGMRSVWWLVGWGHAYVIVVFGNGSVQHLWIRDKAIYEFGEIQLGIILPKFLFYKFMFSTSTSQTITSSSSFFNNIREHAILSIYNPISACVFIRILV